MSESTSVKTMTPKWGPKINKCKPVPKSKTNVNPRPIYNKVSKPTQTTDNNKTGKMDNIVQKSKEVNKNTHGKKTIKNTPTKNNTIKGNENKSNPTKDNTLKKAIKTSRDNKK